MWLLQCFGLAGACTLFHFRQLKYDLIFTVSVNFPDLHLEADYDLYGGSHIGYILEYIYRKQPPREIRRNTLHQRGVN